MQGVNRVDSLSQFMSLVQDARTRNQALGGSTAVAGSTKIARRTVAPVQSAPVRPAAYAPMQVRNPEVSHIAMKPLGGRFDAYA